MFALYRDNERVSKTHSTHADVVVEAYERRVVLNSADEGYEIKEVWIYDIDFVDGHGNLDCLIEYAHSEEAARKQAENHLADTGYRSIGRVQRRKPA